ncbi:mechanosensitive ion channel family protein [Bacteroidota bacterium]
MKELIELPYIKYSILIIGTLVVALVVSRVLRFVLNRFIKSSSKKLKVDPTQFSFLKNAVSFLVFLGAFIFILYSIPQLKALSLTLFAGAGIITAIILFASQTAFSNIVSGIFIVIFKPFRVNDIVDVGNLSKGRVEDITLRHTVIRSYENRRLIIPNSVISSEVIINSSIVDELICNFLELGISYDSDIGKAMEIIRNEAQQHPEYIDNRTAEEKKKGEPSVRIRVLRYGESSVDLRAYIWSRDHDLGFIMKSDLYKSIKEKFDKNGIEIPFPYRTIVYKEK